MHIHRADIGLGAPSVELLQLMLLGILCELSFFHIEFRAWRETENCFLGLANKCANQPEVADRYYRGLDQLYVYQDTCPNGRSESRISFSFVVCCCALYLHYLFSVFFKHLSRTLVRT